MSIKKTKGIIAAGHEKTAEAGCEMLRLGGNAFDAAIAASFASFVSESTLTSAGGGGYLLAHHGSVKKDFLFDFFVTMPGKGTTMEKEKIDFFPVQMDFGTTSQTFHIGCGSIAIPGNIAGLFEVHKQFGTLPMKDIISPALTYAADGIEINCHQSKMMTILKQIITNREGGRALYTREGKLIPAGKMLKMTEFADALDHLAREGADSFYRGDIARLILKDLSAKGGLITEEDLSSYKVIQREPFRFQYRGETICTNPPPARGGVLVAFTLKLMENSNMEKIGFGSLNHLKLLAAVMAVTNEARDKELKVIFSEQTVATDEEHDNVDQFLIPKIIRKYQARLSDIIEHDSLKGGVHEERSSFGSTTHISVLDEHGNAVSLTTSGGEGSGYIIPKTGIMLNNMLGEEDINPDGFHRWTPGTRLSSMMCPTVVIKRGEPEIVLGSGGSNRIRTAIIQVILNILDFKFSPGEAVNFPRVHWERGKYDLEPGFTDEILEKLRDWEPNLQLWDEKSMFFGGVHTVHNNIEKNVLDGAGDERRGGVVKEAR
jgi:gamma-glutamyltranspeptidase/glutathione hydrolase